MTLVKIWDSPELNDVLRENNRVFRFRFPLPSYLDEVRFYPVIFYVDSSGLFSGFQIAGQEPTFRPNTKPAPSLQ